MTINVDPGAGADAGTGPRLDALMRLESEVGVLIRRARLMLGASARLVHPGMHAGSFLMLMWISHHGPVRAAAIAEEFCIDKGAVSRMVQSLLELELVDRHPDPADGRAHLVSVTKAAQDRLDAVASKRRSGVDERLGDWSGADLDHFRRLLARYNQALSA